MNTGFIVAFSGSFNNGYPIDKETGLVDTSWHICDGTNGTPDLRGKFILGSSDSHAVGSTGGEETHTLNEAELPKLSGYVKHLIRWGNDWKTGGILINSTALGTRFPSASTENAYDTQLNINFGGDQSHNNMPPYYTLSFIMKIEKFRYYSEGKKICLL